MELYSFPDHLSKSEEGNAFSSISVSHTWKEKKQIKQQQNLTFNASEEETDDLCNFVFSLKARRKLPENPYSTNLGLFYY